MATSRKEYRTFEFGPLTDLATPARMEPNAARLWIRSDQAVPLTVSWWLSGTNSDPEQMQVDIDPANSSDNTVVVRLSPLLSAEKYSYTVARSTDGHVLGEGTFETAPANPGETPAKFAIALMSCNQPFNSNGATRPETRQMLRATLKCLDEHEVKMIFMVGDQIYIDYPKPLSLFNKQYFATVAPPGRRRILDCTEEEIRTIYQFRYRLGWKIPEWKQILASYPCYMMWDDHEIVNNWGSVRKHRQPQWQRLGKGARQAFIDYQGSRAVPIDSASTSCHYSVEYGPTAAFVMDLRSSRSTAHDGSLIGTAQWDEFRHFLEDHADKSVLFLVLSVPVVHMPGCLMPLLSRIPFKREDFADRWSSKYFKQDRERFFERLQKHQTNHPEQRIVVLSGDIHAGCMYRIQWESDPSFHQFISSPITNVIKESLAQKIHRWLIRLNRRISTKSGNGKVRLVDNELKKRANPCSNLNLGIVEVRTADGNERSGLQFFLYNHDGDEPVCVFRSGKV